MARTFTRIPSNTFETLQLNAGIIVSSFDPETKAYDGILGSTSGGVSFTDVPSYVDWGEDIDNAPRNTKELKQIESREVTMSGTFVSVTASTIKKIAATADIDGTDETHIIPRDILEDADFVDIWWIGDYGEEGGFMAIHLKNALSTGGLSIQSGDRAKGQFAFTFTGHYSIDDMDEVPYEIYLDGGEAETTTTDNETNG